jgi:hypothetical protein
MLLNARELEGIAAGQISLVFHRWPLRSANSSSRG